MVNLSKYKAVLHHIIAECSNKPNVGKTVLYKLLYFSDFDFYEEHEKKMTEEQYCKLQFGPAPTHFDSAIKQMKEEGKVKEIRVNYGGNSQTKFVSLEEPDLDGLSAEELDVINKTISKLSTMSARQVSAYSHKDMPWKSAKDNEELDYEMVFYRDDMMSVTGK